jgi:metal-sulfur cluster biosynthetic enzyme
MTIEDTVRAELNLIVDPCSVAAGAPAGLVEMGLIRALTVTPTPEGASVQVRIGVTEPGCLMGAAFATQARQRLTALPGVHEVTIELDHAADWLPTDLAPTYQLRLAEVRTARTATTPRTRSDQDG